MKILHLSTGVQTSSQVFKLHLELLKRGVQSEILTVRATGDLPNVREISLIDKMLYSAARILSMKIAKYRYNGGVVDLSFINIKKYIASISPDVVHVHVGYGGFLSAKKLREIEHKLVCTCHDLWHFNVAHPICDSYIFQKKEFEKKRSKVRTFTNLYDKIVFPSIYSKELSGFNEKSKCLVIPNLIDPTVLNEPLGKEEVENDLVHPITIGLSATRRTFEKGFDRVEHLVRSRRFHFNFISCGGVKIEGVQALWQMIEHSQMKSFFNSIDCLLIPSRFESFSQLCVESLINDVPVLLMNKIGCVEYLEEWMYLVIEESTCQAEVEDFIKTFKMKSKDYRINKYFHSLYDSAVTEYCILYRDLFGEIN